MNCHEDIVLLADQPAYNTEWALASQPSGQPSGKLADQPTQPSGQLPGTKVSSAAARHEPPWTSVQWPGSE